VQYRNTGVILKIKPVIHSTDQVDLEVNQEVSAVVDKATAVGNSPSFSKRQLDTKLTLKHGSTYILGGLISSDSTNTNKGVPFLKDLPLVGRAFGSNTGNSSRTELIVLITPYIVSDDGEARAVTEAFRKQLGNWAEEKKPAARNP
jgi:general secretion pathway protein D